MDTLDILKERIIMYTTWTELRNCKELAPKSIEGDC